MSSLHQGFQETGQSADAAFRWLDQADAHPLLRQLKQQMLDVSPVGPGMSVLDVGCGLGHEVRRLGERVGANGRAVGIDVNAAMIAEARRRVAGGNEPVAFDVLDAHEIGFGDDTFDVCRTERVLRYVDRPEQVLAEMVRVTRPGGKVVAFDFDSDHTVVDAPDPAIVRRVAEALDAAVPHPWIGRQLFRLFHQAGLAAVRVVPYVTCVPGPPGFAIYRQLNQGTIEAAVAAGRLAASEVTEWWAALEQAAQDGTFFCANLGFIVAGDKQQTG